MVCIFKCKGFQQLSGKDTVWVIIMVSTYVFLLVVWIRNLAGFTGRVAAVASLREQHQQAKELRSRLSNTKIILSWKRHMRHANRLQQCNSSSKCLFTHKKSLFGGHYDYFDAIVFDQTHFNKKWFPIPRSPSQLYIFTSEESPSNYPACKLHNDNFFNWTFTYRLDSDIIWKFFVVRNLQGKVVAPSPNVQWNKTSLIPHKTLLDILKGKSRAAAWIVSDCKTMSFRDQHLMTLQEQLAHFSIEIDIFGDCTKRLCENGDCGAMLREKYYFYLAFENSLDDDYVTREVLLGYDNYAVPIVYGGANYSRFLPPDSYVDAREVHPHKLAKFIHLTMSHPTVHQSFFTWTNHYSIHSGSYNPACDLCKAISSDRAQHAPAKKNFRFWWNTPNGMKWCLPYQFWSEYTRNNLDASNIYPQKY